MPVSRVLSHDEIDAVLKRAKELKEAGEKEAVWQIVAPLISAQTHDKYAAHTLIQIVNSDGLSHEHALAALEAIDATHTDDVETAICIAENLDKAININFLNAAPSESTLFGRVIGFLEQKWRQCAPKDEVRLLNGLAHAARIFGRQKDSIAERAHTRRRPR